MIEPPSRFTTPCPPCSWRWATWALCWGAFLGAASGVEWSQYRGANHDGISPDRIRTDLASAPLLWRVPCPKGLSSFAVGGGKVFTQVLRDAGAGLREYCVALDGQTGQELWAAEVGSGHYDSGVGSDDGPRSTPAVAGGRVYILSSFLDLHCLDAATGTNIWTKNLRSTYQASVIAWQSAASPLVDDDLLFLNANTGAQSLFAFRAADGTVAWRSQSEKMTHSTPVAVTLDGVRQVIFSTQSGLVSLHRANGALLWKAPYPFAYTTSLAASPVVYSNIVFISANYSMGSFATRITSAQGLFTSTPLWTNTNYKAHWMTPVCRNGFLYGMFGSARLSPLKCIDILTGKEKWSVNGFGRGGTVAAGEHLVSLSETGDLVVFQPNPQAYTEVSRWTAFPGYDPDRNKCWNVPAVSDGRIYARSTAEAIGIDAAIPLLKFLPPTLTPFGLTLRIGTTTGAPLDSTRAAKLQLHSSPSLSTPARQWSAVPATFHLVEGTLETTTALPGADQCFYLLSEVP